MFYNPEHSYLRIFDRGTLVVQLSSGKGPPRNNVYKYDAGILASGKTPARSISVPTRRDNERATRPEVKRPSQIGKVISWRPLSTTCQSRGDRTRIELFTDAVNGLDGYFMQLVARSRRICTTV